MVVTTYSYITGEELLLTGGEWLLTIGEWLPLLKIDSGKTHAKRWASKTPGNSQIPAFCQSLSR